MASLTTFGSMTNSEVEEQFEILRRIAERGRNLAHDADTRFIDLFQHTLDELERTRKAYEHSKTTEATSRYSQTTV